MPTVEVYHGDVHVATVEAPETAVTHALDYAWIWTNNTTGSWSRPGNPNHSRHVTVRAPLPVHNGQTYGLRSSMVGDRFTVGGKDFIVEPFGFRELVA